MKLALLFLPLVLLTLPLAAEDLTCFKVHDMWASDLDHYAVEWTNTCHFEMPAIYVAVEFWDGAKRLGAGIWSLYYPGRRHKFDEWTSPVDLPRSTTIRVRAITRDAGILEAKQWQEAKPWQRSGVSEIPEISAKRAAR